MLKSRTMIIAAVVPLSICLSVPAFARGGGGGSHLSGGGGGHPSGSTSAFASAHQSAHVVSGFGSGGPVYGHHVVHAGAGTNTTAIHNSNGRFAAGRDTGPARAADRMNVNGRLNTNGPNALDRDKGRARAEDRTGKFSGRRNDRDDRKFRDRDDRASRDRDDRRFRDRDRGPDHAADRMSANGLRNTNGPNALDRDKGLARAEDRHEMRVDKDGSVVAGTQFQRDRDDRSSRTQTAR